MHIKIKHVHVNNARSSLCEIVKQFWKINVTKVPKLRTFIKYKDEYLTETFAYKVYAGVKVQLWLNLDNESYHL